jgi:hypothetical protein
VRRNLSLLTIFIQCWLAANKRNGWGVHWLLVAWSMYGQSCSGVAPFLMCMELYGSGDQQLDKRCMLPLLQLVQIAV